MLALCDGCGNWIVTDGPGAQGTGEPVRRCDGCRRNAPVGVGDALRAAIPF